MTLEIMMPFYGSPAHFRLAVESVLAQTDEDWRLTIVDDAYPDSSPGEWVAAIDDERVIYLRNEKNLRPSRNYNKCIGLAQEEFVVMMGCDDVMLPNYVSNIKKLISRFPTADVFQPGVRVIDNNDTVTRPLGDRVKGWYRFRGSAARVMSGEAFATSILRGNWTYFPSLAWRTARLREFGFRNDLDIVQDLAMLMEIAKAGGSIVIDNDVAFHYRRHRRSASAIAGADGSKFAQESTLFAESTTACRSLGWNKAARVSQRHLSSILHAITELPGAIATGNSIGRRALTRHILRRPAK